MRTFLLIVGLSILSSLAYGANLSTKTRVVWVGQFTYDSLFYFAAEDKDPGCSSTATSGHYIVSGTNAKGIYAMLLAAASSGKPISFSIAGCNPRGIAQVSEMYYHAN